MTDETVAALARHGNLAAALKRAHGSARLVVLARTTRLAPGIFAPLIDHRGEDLVSLVTVSEGADGPCFGCDAAAAESVASALDEAWRQVGGTGSRPPLTVDAEIPRLLGVGVEGRSLHLPVLLAAVAHLGEEVAVRSVVATGDFAASIDALDRKKALAATLGLELLVASEPPVGPSCSTPADAIGKVFPRGTWHSSADVARLHFYVGDRAEPPARFEGRAEAISLGAKLEGREDLKAALDRIAAGLSGKGRAEVSVGGPVVLAAALGFRLKATPTHVRLIHEDQPWWSNRAKVVPAPTRSGAGTRERRVVVTTGNATRTDWERFDVQAPVSALQIPGLVTRFLAEYADGSPLHLAFATPLALAWAIAHTLRNNVKPVHLYYRLPDGTYECWYTDEGT